MWQWVKQRLAQLREFLEVLGEARRELQEDRLPEDEKNPKPRKGKHFSFYLCNKSFIKVIMLSQEEARKLKHNWVGTEQILLGLLQEEKSPAGQALKAQQVSLSAARIAVEKMIGRGRGWVSVEIPFTPRAKHVLEESSQVAEEMGHDEIGPEHLLLGLLRAGDGVGLQILEKLNVDTTQLREDTLQLIANDL